MKFDQLLVLLPCRSLEDLSLERSPAEAEELLSAWCALWHPALVVAAQNIPHWGSAEEAPYEPAGHLVVVPPCCESLLPSEWTERAEAATVGLIRNQQRRDPMVAAALKFIEGDLPPIDPELVADFFALGFCHFLIEMLTRQMRYMSNLDEASFRSAALDAANAAAGGDGEAARRHLQSAFDRLHESREYFYPVQPYLLDLTLVAPTTIGQSLRDEIASNRPVNLLASGEVIKQIAQREPETLAALKDALANNRAGLIGGEYREEPLPLMPPEAIRAQLECGLTAYEKHLGQRPTVFGRRRFGLTPALPPILSRLGFVGAMHFTLDDGRFPSGNQSRMQWEGFDGTTIETVARVPIDISRADAFLNLPEKLGNAMDLDYSATIVLAHWPGQSSPWYDDLQRIAKYTTVAGNFATISHYFEQTGSSGQRTRHKPDQYRSPYLAQGVAAAQRDPISRWVRYYNRRATLAAAESIDFLTAASLLSAPDQAVADAAQQLAGHVENALAVANDPGEDLDRLLAERLEESLIRFCSAVGGEAQQLPSLTRMGEGGEGESPLGPCATETPRSCGAAVSAARAAGGTPAPHIPSQRRLSGYLLANPTSFPRRLCVETPALAELPEVAGTVRAAGESGAKKTVLVDVPAMGFAWIGPGAGNSATTKEEKPKGWKFGRRTPPQEVPLAEETTLRNEFFTVVIDPHTGAIRAISTTNSRGPRLAQQLALRLPTQNPDDSGHDSNYSVMTADEITITSAGPVLGEIVCRGRLVDRQVQRLAGFTQITRVWRGSRIIELDIELDIDQLPGPNPWNSYYAARFAWSDEAVTFYRDANLADTATELDRLEAPHFIDMRLPAILRKSDTLRTTILTGGLPYHRRHGLRKLDTLLVVQGETARHFRLAIGIDLPAPLPAALGFLTPQTMISATSPPPNPAAWLFHLDARNVIATHWEPIVKAGRVEGFRVRLLETEGRNVRLGLRCCRAVKSAQKLIGVVARCASADPTAAEETTASAVELVVEGDQIKVDIGSHAWVEVEARF